MILLSHPFARSCQPRAASAQRVGHPTSFLSRDQSFQDRGTVGHPPSTISPQSLNRYSYVANDPINSIDPAGRFILALDRFLDIGFSFGSGWDEFDLLGGFQQFCVNSGSGDNCEREPYLFEPEPYGGGPDLISDGRNQARAKLSDTDCAQFLKQILAGTKNSDNLDDFLHSFDKLIVIPTPDRSHDAYFQAGGRRDVTAHVDPFSYPGTSPGNITVHVDHPEDEDVPDTLLHEAFHTFPYGENDIQLAVAAHKLPANTPDSQDNENKASALFSQAIHEKCGNDKKGGQQ